MRSSNKRRGVLGQLITLTMLVLVLAFLVGVSPVNGLTCTDKCGTSKKTNVVTSTEYTDAKVTNYWKSGVKYTLWAHKSRICESGQYYQDCQDMAYCGVNNKCEKVGDYTKWGKTYKTCGSWKVEYYFSTQA